MNDMTAPVGTAVAIPAGAELAVLFKAENGLEPILTKLEAAARAEAATYDVGTAKGRDGLKSLAYKVRQSKAELDRQGKSLTEQQRKEIEAVNAGRRISDLRLSTLADEVRKPLTAWEQEQETRKARLDAAIGSLQTHGVTAEDTSADISAAAARIKAIEIGNEFGDQLEHAEAIREGTLSTLRQLYAAAKQREDQAAELAQLRAEKAERERLEAERLEREQADREAEEAEQRRIDEAARIEREKLEAAERARKDAEAKAEQDCIDAEQRSKAEAERIQREADERAAQERQEATNREAALQRQIEDQRRETEAAAQRERDRIAAEQKAEADARAKREADAAHRAKIKADISNALATMAGQASPDAIANALIEGKIPHCKVSM